MKKLIIRRVHIYIKKMGVNMPWDQYGISTGHIVLRVLVDILIILTGIYSGKTKRGDCFFKRLILSDSNIKALIKNCWSDFLTNHPSDLMSHIENQSFIISGAKERNLEIWSRNLVTHEVLMKKWLEKRIRI